MLPLTDGDALGLIYLEWLTINTPLDADSTAFIHDEYAKLLMEKIPPIGYVTYVDSEILNEINLISLLSLCRSVNHAENDITVNAQDTEEVKLYKILRSKLQALLQASEHYRAERIIEHLPPHFLHEYALLLSRMKCHEEVLQVYVHFLNDLPLAEKYCSALYT